MTLVANQGVVTSMLFVETLTIGNRIQSSGFCMVNHPIKMSLQVEIKYILKLIF